jgi:hypothetical protein
MPELNSVVIVAINGLGSTPAGLIGIDDFDFDGGFDAACGWWPGQFAGLIAEWGVLDRAADGVQKCRSFSTNSK